MRFQTVSIFLTALIAAASAAPPESPPEGHPPQGHPPQGHPPHGHPPQGHPPSGHPPFPLPPLGHLPPCKPGHAWPDHHDCHSFFECSAGNQPVRKTCGPGAAYCWEVGVCVHEQDVPSCSKPGPATIPKGHGQGPPGLKGHP